MLVCCQLPVAAESDLTRAWGFTQRREGAKVEINLNFELGFATGGGWTGERENYSMRNA